MRRLGFPNFIRIPLLCCLCAWSLVEEGTPKKHPNMGREKAVEQGRPRFVFKVVFSLRPNPWRSCITFLLHCITR